MEFTKILHDEDQNGHVIVETKLQKVYMDHRGRNSRGLHFDQTLGSFKNLLMGETVNRDVYDTIRQKLRQKHLRCKINPGKTDHLPTLSMLE